MNMLESMGSSPVTQALGWTLVHSVWQGALIGAAVAVLLVLLRRSSANLRYLVCCGGMALMMVAPPATLILILRSPFEPLAVDVDEAQNMCERRSVGVEAVRLVLNADACQVERSNGLGFAG